MILIRPSPPRSSIEGERSLNPVNILSWKSNMRIMWNLNAKQSKEFRGWSGSWICLHFPAGTSNWHFLPSTTTPFNSHAVAFTDSFANSSSNFWNCAGEKIPRIVSSCKYSKWSNNQEPCNLMTPPHSIPMHEWDKLSSRWFQNTADNIGRSLWRPCHGWKSLMGRFARNLPG